MMNYIRQLFGAIFEISMMYVLLDCTVKLKKRRYQAILYAAVTILVNAFALYKMDYNSYMKLFPLFVYIPVFVFFLLISDFNAKKVLFVHLTLIGVWVSFTSIASIISFFVGYSNEMVNIIVYIIWLPAWFLIYKFIRPLFLYMLRNSNTGWLGFCLIPLSYTVLIYTIGSFSMDTVINANIVKDAVLFLVLAFTAYYMILKLFKQTREQFILQNEQDLLKTQVSAAQTHLEALQESQKKTIIYRHDMRHHLNLISAYLADDNKAAAQKYISDVESSIEDAVLEKYCSNYTVNLILSSYIKKAKEAEIKVETQIDLPENSQVSDMDLCVIFTNAIENAINACKNILSKTDRTLNIICKNKSNKLFIQITNSCDGDVSFADEMPLRTDGNHGLGTKSITSVVQKYGGVYSFSAENRVFCVNIIL